MRRGALLVTSGLPFGGDNASFFLSRRVRCVASTWMLWMREDEVVWKAESLDILVSKVKLHQL